jgi:hypothetical protein
MWVGPEVLLGGGTRTGVFELQSTPLFQDWLAVAGAEVHVSDCNIVPCARYTIEAVTEVDYPAGTYTDPFVLSTVDYWGDIVGQRYVGGTYPYVVPDWSVDGLDIVAAVDCFKDRPGAVPRSWCDLHGNRTTQGVNLNIDGLDITVLVNAFKGFPYPHTGPTAPAPCPGNP